jgi:hypothetical protein
MRPILQGFCINQFGIFPLHYILSLSDFGFEYVEIFVIEKWLPDSLSRGAPTLRLGEWGSRRFSDLASPLLNV